MSKSRVGTGLCAAVVLLLAGGATARAATIYTLDSDAQVNGSGTVDATGTESQTGFSGSDSRSTVYVFALPDLSAGEAFASASFTCNLASVYGGVSFGGDAYGLDYRLSPDVLGSDAFAGTLDPNATLIQADFVTPSSSSGTKATSAAGNASLVDYLNVQLGESAADRAAGSTAYVFIRVSPDATRTNNYTRYRFRTRDYSTNSYYWSKLNYETELVPEPTALGAFGLAGLVAVLRRRRAE